MLQSVKRTFKTSTDNGHTYCKCNIYLMLELIGSFKNLTVSE